MILLDLFQEKAKLTVANFANLSNQGYYNKFGIKNVYKYHKIFLDNLLPELTFYFNANFSLINVMYY